MLPSMKTLFAAMLVSVAQPPEATISPDRLMEALRALPPERSVLRTPDEQDTLKQTEELLIARLRAIGLEPTEQTLEWSTGGMARVWSEDGWKFVPDPTPRSWRNIYVEFPGAVSPNEVIIVGAHFDSHPNTPGADDNASGVAAALEMARALKDTSTARTIRIVFFNLEEIGLVGSREHAAWMQQRIEQGQEHIVGMLSLEMIGYYADEPNSQRSPIPAIPGVFTPPTVGDFLGVVANQSSAAFARQLVSSMRQAEPALKVELLDFIPGAGEMFPDVRRSDHSPFWDIGAPAVMVTDTSEFRTPHYHQPSDTPDTIDVERFTLATRALTGAVWRLARPVVRLDESNEDR